MKKQLLLIFSVLIYCFVDAQSVGIGTNSPEPSAQLDVSSTIKGILIPRMSMSQRNAINVPATGLMIYQTDNRPGFYYYNGSNWIPVSGSSTGWSLSGNAGIDSLTQFLGTTDNQPLVFKINNERVGFLGNNNNIFWGKGSGNANITGHSNVAIGSGALHDNGIKSNLVAIGDSALYHNGFGELGGSSNGTNNTAVGTKALFANTVGLENTAVGSESLYSNTTGAFNTAIGYRSLFANTYGTANTANGYSSLGSNTTGSNNTATGFRSLNYNTGGSNNTANGLRSLFLNVSGNDNTATGYNSLYSNTNGSKNTATGTVSLYKNTTGIENTATGNRALYYNNVGSNNTATGDESLTSNTSGNYNTADGYKALYSNTTGDHNTASGTGSLSASTSGSDNTAFGASSLSTNNTGSFNTGAGYHALYSNTTGTGNSAVGYYADVVPAQHISHSTAIGYRATVNASNKVRIGNADVTVIEGQVPFSHPSDARFKYNIRDNVPGLNFITRLKPVTYYFDEEKLAEFTKSGVIRNSNIHSVAYKHSRQLHTGFLAQDVEKITKEIGYDFDGIHVPQNKRDHYSLAYSQFVMPLVKAVQEQQVILEKLKERNLKRQKIIDQLNQEVDESKILSIIAKQQEVIEHQISENKNQQRTIQNHRKEIKELQSELKKIKNYIKEN